MSAIRRVTHKRRSKSALALHPAPWNCPPTAPPRGLRHSTQSWAAELSAAQPRPLAEPQATTRRFPNGERGVRTGPFANDLWAGDHIQAGHEDTEKPLTKHNPAQNLSTETVDAAEGRKLKLRTDIPRQTTTTEIPWRSGPASPSHLETQHGKPRGQKHAPNKAFQSSVQIPHDSSVKPKPLRRAGDIRSHGGRIAACFEEGTCVRRQQEPAVGEYRLRSPFGTAHNYSVYEPMRKYTVHYDTRQLLTYC
eukprot:GGOE01043649.1.p1 GENE.GGOE01043649.1~~GGOE01043649.1.p1  ORF type:complete len:262 (-),score=45.97 GGOE01043649.1:115-864(-)